MKKVICIILAMSIAACSSTTVIKSEPTGATVYINGEKAGVTPYEHTDSRIIGTVNTVVLKKEGYQEFSTVFRRNEEVSTGALIGGIFLLVPFLWLMEYKPSHSYEMIPLNDATK